MDYSKFLADNFDAKEWANTAFKNQKDASVSKDQYATTLVMKLQMFIQEVNNTIEESCQQSLQSLPRVIREIDAVRQEASLLQDQMRMVKEDIQKVEQNTSESMQTLLKLDTIKTKMKDASDALQEADNWTTLSADVEEVFQSQDVSAIADRLVGLQQSLHMLTDVPDYNERCQQLENLKNRLEAMVSPQLVAAFNLQSLDAAQTYVKIFGDIDRLPQLYKYYYKCHKTRLVSKWGEIVQYSDKETIPDWMSQFYEELLSVWHEQMTWCSLVFEDPLLIVCQLITETLQSLSPSLPYLIKTALDETDDGTDLGKNPLTLLIDIKQVTERFAKSIEGAISSYTAGRLDLSYINKLAVTIYLPYRAHVQHYDRLEDLVLTQQLNHIRLDHEDLIDCVRLLGESVSQLFSAAYSANDRCVQFTNGCGYVGLLSALINYFNNYLKEFRRVLTNLREKCHVGSMDSDDWSMFQQALRIIQIAGDLILHTEELDQTLVSGIVDSIGSYQQHLTPSRQQQRRDRAERNSFHTFTELLLEEPEDQNEVEALYSKIIEGEASSVLDKVEMVMFRLSSEVHKFAFDIVFSPLQEQLVQVHVMEVWTSETAGESLYSDLPTFSMSPQEYITKIGQYLMTLPQQLEPFTLQDNPALMTAAKHGKLPYIGDQEMPEHLADLWLESIARGTMHTYCEEILKIPELSVSGSRQLITDIDYLCNVLDDLALPASESILDLKILLQTAPDKYSEVADTKPQRLATTIGTMRNLANYTEPTS